MLLGGELSILNPMTKVEEMVNYIQPGQSFLGRNKYVKIYERC